MKWGAKASIGLFVLGAAITLVQLWFSVWSPEVFVKLSITIGILFVVTLVLSFVFKEAAETSKLKDGNEL
jgi:hypothetical protein